MSSCYLNFRIASRKNGNIKFIGKEVNYHFKQLHFRRPSVYVNDQIRTSNLKTLPFLFVKLSQLLIYKNLTAFFHQHQWKHTNFKTVRLHCLLIVNICTLTVKNRIFRQRCNIKTCKEQKKNLNFTWTLFASQKIFNSQ